jgi:hypothetical protein
MSRLQASSARWSVTARANLPSCVSYGFISGCIPHTWSARYGVYRHKHGENMYLHFGKGGD